MGKRISAPAAIVAAFAFIMVLVVGAAPVSGQATPEEIVSVPETDAEAEIELYPAQIQAGTCDDLQGVVYPLNDLQAAAQVDDPDATPVIDLGATPDAAAAIGLVDVAAQSGTEVEATLESLLEEDFAITVQSATEGTDTIIVCGEITGSPDDADLFVDLQEVNRSGFAGRAELTDMGDGTTIVNVSIFPSDVLGTPEATPAS